MMWQVKISNDRYKSRIISQIVLWSENSFRIDCKSQGEQQDEDLLEWREGIFIAPGYMESHHTAFMLTW